MKRRKALPEGRPCVKSVKASLVEAFHFVALQIGFGVNIRCLIGPPNWSKEPDFGLS